MNFDQSNHGVGDLSGLLLLHSAAGDKEGMKSLALKAQEVGRTNVAFLAFFVTGNRTCHLFSIHTTCLQSLIRLSSIHLLLSVAMHYPHSYSSSPSSSSI